MPPTIDEELRLQAAGARRIAGLDEVGRGCWAGPVVAAAVVLSPQVLRDPALLAGVDDSKRLTARQREQFAAQIVGLADGWAIGAVPAWVIDTIGILAATRLAMQIALLRLPELPDALLIDAVRLPHWPGVQHSLVKGDQRCLMIAAASVLAKVARDRLMTAIGQAAPAYKFGEHKGYGTAAHYRALQACGPTHEHRRSFRPLSAYLTDAVWPALHGEAGANDHDD